MPDPRNDKQPLILDVPADDDGDPFVEFVEWASPEDEAAFEDL